MEDNGHDEEEMGRQPDWKYYTSCLKNGSVVPIVTFLIHYVLLYWVLNIEGMKPYKYHSSSNN